MSTHNIGLLRNRKGIDHNYLTLCILGNFSCFCCRLLTLFKIDLFEKFFRNTIRVSNGFDSDQGRHSASPDLCPNCLQRLSTDGKSRH